MSRVGNARCSTWGGRASHGSMTSGEHVARTRLVVAALTTCALVVITVCAICTEKCTKNSTISEASAGADGFGSWALGMSSASISSVPSDVEVLLPGISDFDLLGISGDCYIVSFSGGSNAADLDWMEQRVAEMMSKGGWTRVGENAGGIESFAHEAYDGEGELQGITSAIVMLYDIGGEATVLIQFS